MLTYYLTIKEYLASGSFSFFILFYSFVLGVWALKAGRSLFYRPFQAPDDFRPGTSVIIPVLEEKEGMFRSVLRNITAQKPGEVLVVINGPRNGGLEAVCKEFAEVHVFHLPTANKRAALKLGIEKARHEIVVLVDSDTIWGRETLAELVKPFHDPRVGGVTTHQEILLPGRNWITRFANWMERVRACITLPAMSAGGQVGCLPGRTIAFRRETLLGALPGFLTHRFMGVHLDISDDRWLTNQALKQGYKTVYQRSSRVLTDAPEKLGKFIRQQLRWARGSQYNTVEMTPWMMRNAPFLAMVFLGDILLPFLLSVTLANWAWNEITGQGKLILLGQSVLEEPWLFACAVLASLCFGFAIRQTPLLMRHPKEGIFIPFHILLATLVLIPVRLAGFFSMCFGDHWGTRNSKSSGNRHEMRRDCWKRYLPAAAGAGIFIALFWMARALN